MKRLKVVLLILTLVPALAAQELSFQERHPRYRINPGDVIAFNFSFTPEFNQTVTVQPDGFITLREIGDVRVQNKTTPEVIETVRTAYSKVLNDPVITIELRDFEKPSFLVSGEVARPGKYELRSDTTLVQGVTMAGGLNDRSKSTEVLLFRRISEETVEVKKIDMKRMVSKKDLSEDLQLRAGDMILVPRNRMSKIARFIPVPSLGMYFRSYN